jgi:hypothetical protein
VQDLRPRRAHPGPLAGGKDHDGEWKTHALRIPKGSL